ncbi:hypothetical protein LPJ70_004898 [Coemansia sp. RSA 2708]|nr:hypothetical protein LPJ70_004898 [Coemansia sp. RSA 2708]
MAAAVQRLRTSVAPMVRVTHPYFLRLTRLISPFGNHQLWTEMIHANAFSRAQMHLDPAKLSSKLPLHEIGEFSAGVVVQIASASPPDAHEAVRQLINLGVRNINLNCGCPSRNVQMGSFGAIMMKTPQLVADVVDQMCTAARGTGCQISVKCRIGVDEDESPEFLQRFLSAVVGQRRHADELPVSIVLHARRAWLQGLSPKQNRKIPELNYERVHEMARRFTNTSFVINGGIDTVDSVVEHLAKVDGVMIGRKIGDDPWFLSQLDQHVYGIPAHAVPSPSDVLARYVRYGDEMHARYGARYSALSEPLYRLFAGRKNKALHIRLNEARSKAKRDAGLHQDAKYSVSFSELVLEAVHNAEMDLRQQQDSLESSGDVSHLPSKELHIAEA